MLLVEIEKPENLKLATWFSEMREWLDLHRCAPSAFVASGRRIDRLIYRISFDDANQAQQFATDFARFSPTVRRANPHERDQLRTLATPLSADDGAAAGAAD
jgi:hypothetical protein